MAKKAVATFAAKAGAKSMVKCIRMEKSPKTGAYVFAEQLVEAEKAKDYFASKKSFLPQIQEERLRHRGGASLFA